MNNLLLNSPNRDILLAENKIAAVLSIVMPGLGQVYKGHYGEGFLWMFLGMPVALWAGVILGLATAGVGLLLPLVCWAGLAVHAYYEKDRRRHHWLMPMNDDASLDNVAD
jgi:TM2 domain-containing membrane protein YozV